MRVAHPRAAADQGPVLQRARRPPRLPPLLPNQVPIPPKIPAVFLPCGLRRVFYPESLPAHLCSFLKMWNSGQRVSGETIRVIRPPLCPAILEFSGAYSIQTEATCI